jgi:hypothetical protein
VLVLAVLLAGCTPVNATRVTRTDALPAQDATMSAPYLDLAREQYATLGRVANAFDSQDRSAEVRQSFTDAVQRCEEALPDLRQPIPGESDAEAERRHLVIGGCELLAEHRADTAAVDRSRSLFVMALQPADAPLAPVTRRS